MSDMKEGFRMSGVRHPEPHSLRVDRTAIPGERIKRQFWCMCGYYIGEQYDTNARIKYRQHLPRRKKGTR